MKKLLFIIATLLPSLAFCDSNEFSIRYMGWVVLLDGTRYEFDNIKTYYCNVNIKGYEYCMIDTRKQAQENCTHSLINMINKAPYKEAVCNVI